MYPTDPQSFLVDPEVRPFIRDFRHDLLAANAPVTSAGNFIVADLVPDSGQILVIKAFAFYAMERVNVGVANQAFRMIDPVDANGYFNFEPLIRGSSPFHVELDYNRMRVAAGPLDDTDRNRTKGISWLSSDPYQDVQRAWYNPMFSTLVPSGQSFQVTFTILADAVAAPLTNGRYSVGGAIAGTRRVDAAGAVIVGMAMSEQYYRDIMTATLNRR